MSPKDKAVLDKIYKKHYGKDVCKSGGRIGKTIRRNQRRRAEAMIKETDRDIALRICPELKKPSPNEGIIMAAGSSRNDLMLQAKAKSIKNFRVLNKQELTDCLANIGDQKKCDAIISGAVTRWKAGWGKKKEESTCPENKA